MCIVGELGAGKTLTLSYLAWKNHFIKGRDIFSNYSLYGMPHTRIRSLADLEKMRDGFFAGDELWLWLDSRTSSKQMNKVTSDILLKSRKRGLTYCLPPDEEVLTENGYKAIETIEIGDKVLTHKGRYKRVTNKFERIDYQTIRFVPSEEKFSEFRVTPEHPIRVFNLNGYEWKPANEVDMYDMLVRPKNKEINLLSSIQQKVTEQYRGKVYNLEVEEDNSYVTTGSAVHNCFTAQNMKQVDTRVRKVIDFTVYPVMTANERMVKALVFHGSSPDSGNFMRALRFKPKPVYKFYNSREEVKPLKQKNDIPFIEGWNDERDLQKIQEEDEYDII